jgi:tetratricopeptide (TPR) repeat protein
VRTLTAMLCLTVVGCAGRAVEPPVARPAAPALAAEGPQSAPGSLHTATSGEGRAPDSGPSGGGPVAVELADIHLREALTAYESARTARGAQSVAEQYARLGIADRAHHYYSAALALDPGHHGAHDGLARLWRDAGLPHLGLTNSYRAIYYAPDSPSAHNTLGTLLQALGQRSAARAAYERALLLDPAATYALNNLCYARLLEGHTAQAIEACSKALALDPAMVAARNNLALAYAAMDRMDDARMTFAAGDPADALYNTGILHLARGEYRDALHAFSAAHTARPWSGRALARARQAAARLGFDLED